MCIRDSGYTNNAAFVIMTKNHHYIVCSRKTVWCWGTESQKSLAREHVNNFLNRPG